jgi:hypothetical protein
LFKEVFVVVLPNFLIIGAARSGTTSLYRYIQDHPDIYLPQAKRPEPHFFLKEEEYKKGLDYYSEKYFSQWSGEKAAGEASTSYLYQSHVARRIHKHLPEVRLIAILRNPVDRAYSNYWITVQNGLDDVSFEEAVGREGERINAPKSKFWEAVQPQAYLDRGYYFRQLNHYLEYFKREQLLILLFNDLRKSPGRVVREVFRFLEVDEGYVPHTLGIVNNKTATPYPPMDPNTRKRLIALFANENRRLSHMIGRDLSCWDE